MLEILRHLVAPDPAQDQDWCFHSKIAQEDAFLQHRYADIVGLRPQLPGHFRQAVAVGIGLDNNHHSGRCHICADGLQVPAQPGQVDLGPGGAHALPHGNDRLIDGHEGDCTASYCNMEILVGDSVLKIALT